MARKQGITAADTAQAIRTHALALFARYGYEAVSMRQIASAVGVMPGALYHHFATKQDLLMCLMEEHMSRLLKAWDAQLEDTDFTTLTAAEKLHCFVRFHIRYHIKLPDDVFLSYMELRSLEEPYFKKIEFSRKSYETILKNILNEGHHASVMHIKDVHVTAMALLGMLTGLHSWFSQSGRLSEDNIINCYIDLAAKMVGLQNENNLSFQPTHHQKEELHV